jgi:hypothetical protein
MRLVQNTIPDILVYFIVFFLMIVVITHIWFELDVYWTNVYSDHQHRQLQRQRAFEDLEYL